jgi:hypothetical protein
MPLRAGAFYFAPPGIEVPRPAIRPTPAAHNPSERRRAMMLRTHAALAQTESRLAVATRSLQRAPGALAPLAF